MAEVIAEKITIGKSLQKGNEVADPTKMKKNQLKANLAAALTGLLCYWAKKEYPDFPIFEYQDILTGIFVSVLGSINMYFTAASSKKVGVTG